MIRTGVHGALRPFALLLLGAALAGGCGRPSIGTDVVVTVDGEAIRYAEFESYLRDTVGSSDLPLEPPVLDQLFDQFLDERLLVRLAEERRLAAGSGSSGAAPAGGQRPDQRAAIAYLLRQARPRPPGEAEIAAYYAAHRDEYWRPAAVRLKQILVHEREDAEAARAALAAGESFDEVAARFSQVPMAHLGDDSGRLTRDDLPEAFADAIFALEPGEVSDIFPADYGFHLFQVVERSAAEEAPLADVAVEIRRILERQQLDELVASFIAEARGRYNVEIHRPNFPFDYRGSYVRDHRD